jgi:hypothetical protein
MKWEDGADVYSGTVMALVNTVINLRVPYIDQLSLF